MIPLSVLDLSPIVEGADAGEALRRSTELAQQVERLGYRRYWMAEHHNIPGVASAATAVALAHVAANTSTIRIGAGGVMLPNHAPLVIAEQFGTLEALHPGRIDLGLGRAPGSDQVTARALRRTLASDVDSFPQDVLELMAWFEPAQPNQAVRAIPGEGLRVPIWILGSSLYGAQLAAALGLPYAFASHFAPDALMQAAEIYRSRFKPSDRLDKPYLAVAAGVVAADTDAEAKRLFTSQQQAFARLRTGQPGKLPPPVDDIDALLPPMVRAGIDHALSCAVVGSPETVREDLNAFAARTGADELILTTQTFDPQARLRSFKLVAQAMGQTPLRLAA